MVVLNRLQSSWSRFPAWSLTGLIVVTLSACGGPGNPPPPDPQNSGVLAPGTHVLREPETAVMTEVREDGTFVFSAVVGVLADVDPGDVILVGVTPLTPYGAVRNVDAVTPVGGGVAFATSPAGLGDAFEELTLSADFTATAEMDASGASVVTPSQGGITFPFDFTASGGGGSARLRGALGIAPTVDVTIDIDVLAFELDELSFSVGASESFEAILTGSGTASFEESVPLGTIPFTPFVVPVPTPSGVVPVPVTPVMELSASLGGSLQGQLEVSVVQQASFTASVGYQNGSWGTNSDSDSDLDFDQPTFGAALSVKAAAEARVVALVLGIGGPYASAEAYVQANAATEGDVVCVRGVLDAGLGATLGVELLTLDFERRLLDERFPLASIDTCDPNAPRPATTWSRSYSRTGSIGENARAIVAAPDGTYLLAGDSTLTSGVTGAAASVWVLRLDALGNVMWQRSFGGLAALGNVVGATFGDDGFYVATTVGIVRLDIGGNVEWVRNLDSSARIVSLDARHGGGVVVAGTHGTGTDAWLATITDGGAIGWSRSYGEGALNRVRPTSDGGYVATGVTASNASDALVVKVGSGGALQWAKAIDNLYDPTGGTVPEPTMLNATDTGMDVIERQGGTFLLVGETYGGFPLPEEGQAGHYALFTAELSGGGEMVSPPTVHRAQEDAYYTSGFAVALRDNGSSVIVGRYAGQAQDLLQAERILVLQGSAYSVLGGVGDSSVMGGLLGGGVGSMPVAATPDGGVIVAGTTDGFGTYDEAWVTKFGRTLAIEFPYVANVSGVSFSNDHAVQLDVIVPAGQAAVSLTPASANVEVTPMAVRVHAP